MNTPASQSNSPIALYRYGELPRITAQEKGAYCARVGRKYIPQFFDKPEMTAAKKTLKSMLVESKPSTPFDCAVSLRIYWEWPWRKSEPMKNRQDGYLLCYTLPDYDNLVKSLGDCMNKLGYFTDDGRIAHAEFTKTWGDLPGLGIELGPITHVPATFARLLHLREFGS